jgi:hypothetical protein
MSLKEWREKELNTLLMKKWGFLKESKRATTGDPTHDPDEDWQEPIAELRRGPESSSKWDRRVQGWVARKNEELGNLDAVLAAAEEDPSIGDPVMLAIQAEVDKLRAEGGGSEDGLEEMGIKYRQDEEAAASSPLGARSDDDEDAYGAFVSRARAAGRSDSAETGDDDAEEWAALAAAPGASADTAGTSQKFGGRNRGQQYITDPAVSARGGTVPSQSGPSRRLGKRRATVGALGSGRTWGENVSPKISVREAKEITRRIIKRIRKEGK